MIQYEMRLPLRQEPWPNGQNEARPCPVCGKPWIPWAGSRLPCHGRCLFPERDRQLMQADPRTDLELSKALGVTTSVVRSARKRRG